MRFRSTGGRGMTWFDGFPLVGFVAERPEPHPMYAFRVEVGERVFWYLFDTAL